MVQLSLHRIRTYESYDTCPICMCDIKACGNARRLVKETPCNHCFHPKCLNKWLQKNNTCPMCRTEVVNVPPPPPIGWLGIYRHDELVRNLGPIFDQMALGDVVEREPSTPPLYPERPRGVYYEDGEPLLIDYGAI